MTSENKHQNKIVSEEYKSLLLDSYKENQNFLNKLILSVSALAIPLLFEQIRASVNDIVSGLLVCSLVGFIVVVLVQIYSLKIARDGCDKSLSSNSDDLHSGSGLLLRAKRIDLWRDRSFVAALVLIVLAVITFIATKEYDMNNKNREIGWLSQAIDKSFTPPVSHIIQHQKPASSEATESGKQVETTASSDNAQNKK